MLNRRNSKEEQTLARLVLVIAHLQQFAISHSLSLTVFSIFQFRFQSICSHWVSYCTYLCAVHCLLMDQHCSRYVIVCCLVVFAYHFLCLQVSCHFSFYYGVFFFFCFQLGRLAVWWLLRHLLCLNYATERRWVMYWQYTVCSTFWLAYFSGVNKTRILWRKKISLNGRLRVFHCECGTDIGVRVNTDRNWERSGRPKRNNGKNVLQRENVRERCFGCYYVN